MARPDQLSIRLAALEAAARSAGWLPASTAVVDAATLGGYPASHFAVAGSLSALAENTSAPPTASATYLGQFYYYRPASSPGRLLFCQRDSAGGYEWTVVALAGL